MAAREDNLKKINAELEKLSDEELEGVAGGSAAETASDSRFLNSLNGSTDRYGETRIRLQDHDYEIRDAWKRLGVDVTIYSGNLLTSGSANTYKIDGKTVSRVEAINHAMDVAGKHMAWNSWEW